ncbi:MAG: DUF2628 domain-containing protein [Candidatus Accumulibacter sp.]|jgi:TPR repeat protein|nr:DUF2628 domain-containing protein [Accumulibacter sp.]
MYCDQCGTAVQAAAKFCHRCGHQLQSVADELAPENQQETPAPEVIPADEPIEPFPVQQIEPESDQHSEPSEAASISVPSQEELFKAIIGSKNQSYYLDRFQRFEKNGKTLSWHWPAFFVPFFWFFYRKMRSCGILYILLGFPIIATLRKTVEISENPMVVLSCVFLLIGMALWPPLYANSLYYTHCKKLLGGVAALSSGRERKLALLSARGGTSKTVVILFSVTVIAGVLASVLIPKLPQYQKSQNHARREGAGVAESAPQSAGKDTQEKSEQSDEKEQFDPEQIRKAAEQGDAAAQTRLGLMYYLGGEGVPEDVVQAAEWLNRAAEQGHAAAQFSLGTMYATGVGVAKNNRKAFEWIQKAAEQGYAMAQVNLGAMYSLGHGVAKSDRKAFEWWQKAAEQGNAKAQAKLGAIYSLGHGVAKNDRKAFEWFQKAAEQGNADAQSLLGINYWQGAGVIRDRKKACQLWETAAHRRHESAIKFYNKYCSR